MTACIRTRNGTTLNYYLMKEKTDETINGKQLEAMTLCYDRLIEQLKDSKVESTLLKCIETVRKDMAATVVPQSGADNSCIADTIARMDAIHKRLKKLNLK